MIEVFVSRLGFDTTAETHVVVLQEKDGVRLLPIWIGAPEFDSIRRHLQNAKLARPLTHDLVRSLILRMRARLIEVNITRLAGQTYFAELQLQHSGAMHTIDARPSDGIAIALRLGAPIRAAEELLVDPAVEVEVDADADEDDASDDASLEASEGGEAGDDTADVSDTTLSAEQLKRYLETLRPEDFGKFNL